MVFHGDYEVYFEIHQQSEDGWRSELIGYMAGLDPEDAKARWVEAHPAQREMESRIQAIVPLDEWR